MTQLLGPYLDKELDPARSRDAERHLKECAACMARHQEHLALRQVVAGKSLRYEAPSELRRRVQNAVRSAAQAETPSRHSTIVSRLWLSWLAPTAALAGLVLLLAVSWLARPSTDRRLAQAIVSAHLRSLMVEHLTDVASTDQHTVKPWFNGKVTFSPPVNDLAAQGFPLVGGRLDVVEEQPVAALVYQRRKHVINLFIWPSTGGGSTREHFLTERGYNLIYWVQGDMNCWAISDVNRGDLEEFTKLVQARAAPPEGK